MPIDPVRGPLRPQASLNERRGGGSRPIRVRQKEMGERRREKAQSEAAKGFIERLKDWFSRQPRRALVVDDEPDFCRAFGDYLAGRGYIVGLAFSGEEALRAYVRFRPDVVFLDVRMPGKDGIETFEEIRSVDPGARIIMVSAANDGDIIDKAGALGVFYVNKPINYQYLESAIETTLGLRGNIVESTG